MKTPEQKLAFCIGYLRGSSIGAFSMVPILFVLHLVKGFPFWPSLVCIGIGALAGWFATILSKDLDYLNRESK
jgi:hypothetical protein